MTSITARMKTWLKRRVGVPQIEFALERLAHLGFQPELIFDVGAYQGDFARICRKIWGEAEIACFEVQPEPLRRLKTAFAGDANVRAWPYLLGAVERDHVALHLLETGSSVLEEHAHKEFPIAYFPMRTADDIVLQKYGRRAPDLLKMDVQGYELEVLRGAEKLLHDVRIILMEVNLIDIHCGVPLLGEVTQWLGEREFVAYDICGLIRRPLDCALWQADMIFVPANSPFRVDKRWGQA